MLSNLKVKYRRGDGEDVLPLLAGGAGVSESLQAKMDRKRLRIASVLTVVFIQQIY